jgi:hypothetical protein
MDFARGRSLHRLLSPERGKQELSRHHRTRRPLPGCQKKTSRHSIMGLPNGCQLPGSCPHRRPLVQTCSIWTIRAGQPWTLACAHRASWTPDVYRAGGGLGCHETLGCAVATAAGLRPYCIPVPGMRPGGGLMRWPVNDVTEIVGRIRRGWLSGLLMKRD